jgi:hypothetical protein
LAAAGGFTGVSVMIEIGGIEDEDGKSAVVGLPVGTDAGNPASAPVAAAAAAGGAFQPGA